MNIRKFKNFESKEITLSKDDVQDAFQDYLDDLDGEEIEIQIGESIKISIKNDSWIIGKSGIEIPKTLGIMWTKLSNSIEMLCRLHDLNLINIDWENGEDGSVVVTEILLSNKPIGSSPSDMTFQNILDFWEENGDTNFVNIYILDGKILYMIDKLVADVNRNMIYVNSGYDSLTIHDLIDLKKDISLSIDSKELVYVTQFKIEVRKRTISDIWDMPIFINVGNSIKKPHQIIKGTQIKESSIIEQIEEISRLDESIILVLK